MRSRVTILWLLWAAFALLLLPGRTQAQTPAPAGGTRVLVLPFEVNAEPEYAYLSSSLPELLNDKLRERGFPVVPASDMMRLLSERGVEFLDIRVARDMAVLSKADYAVYGSFSQVGDTISIDARLVEAFGIEPTKPLYVVKEGVINILPAMDDLADKIRLELMRKARITEIEVRGTDVLDQDVVLLRIATQKGDIYDPGRVDQDLRRIYDLGYFDDVRVELEDTPDGKKLVYIVEEKPRIAAVNIRGNDEIDEDDILEVMTVKEGSILNLKMLADDLNKVREIYRKEGFYKAEVSYALANPEARQTRLDVIVEEGNELYIRDISIEGAKQIDPDDLKGELALSERGLFSWLTGSGVLKEELLERDAAALEAYYANRGFLEVKVGQPEVEFRDDGIYITFQVSEGPRYRVSGFEIRGDLVESREELAEYTTMDELSKENAYFNRSVVREDIQALTTLYQDYGYAFADVDVDIVPDPETQTVKIAYIPERKQLVYVRRVILEGNTKTRDNVILREMRLADGDLFRGSRINRSTVRLNKLDYFQEVDIETLPTPREDELDLKVKVKEKSTGSLTAAAGYSSYSKVFVSFSVEERNFLGKGYNIRLGGNFSSRDTTYNLSFTNPQLYNTPLSLGMDIFLTEEDFDEYDRESIGGRLRVGYPLGEYTRAFLSYKFEEYEISNIGEEAADEILDYEGINQSSVASLSVRRDTTNRRFNPSKGTVAAVTTETGGGILGGDDEFVKVIESYHYYEDLFWGTIFHWHIQNGNVWRNYTDEEIPPFERIYLGGINTVRGYEYRDISPLDPETGDKIGGTKAIYTNLEFIFPILDDMGIWGVLFFDAGNSWMEDEEYFGDTNSAEGNQPFLGVYKSIGGGIRWLSPLGPLRLEYGYSLDELKEQDERGRFEFTIGTAF